MIYKSADSRSKEIKDLEELCRHPDASDEDLKEIKRMLSNLRSGMAGEAESAKVINYNYGKGAKYWCVIHDLRIKVGSHIAQIDHLLINRLAEIYVCETKYRQYGLAMNEHGEFSAITADGRLQGIESPIEQNRRHIDVLEGLLASSKIPALRRVTGIPVKPLLHSLILVSSNARIDRPKKSFDGMDSIVKTDQLMEGIFGRHKPLHAKNMTITKPHMLVWLVFHTYRMLTRIISQRQMTGLAKKLVAEHQPYTRDWYGKFKLPRNVELRPLTAETRPADETTEPTHGCQACGRSTSRGEAEYCRAKQEMFGGKVLCMACQQNFKRASF